MEMSVSHIINENGKKKAYVLFSDGERSAEGIYPDCSIIKSSGFTQEELTLLSEYMEKEGETIKELAASVNLIKAFGS